MDDSDLDRAGEDVVAALEAYLSALVLRRADIDTRVSFATRLLEAFRAGRTLGAELNEIGFSLPISPDLSISDASGRPIMVLQLKETGRLFDPELSAKLEAALLDVGLSRRDNILEMLRVVAAANGGLVPLRETAAVLKKLGLSRSSASNLPGYLIKRMGSSGEFEREGKTGSGVYRWLRYSERDLGADSAVDIGGDEEELPSG